MYHTLLGESGFRRGMDLYFERHDGSAATVDDFFDAMSDANGGVDISRLKNWYSQAGAPDCCLRAELRRSRANLLPDARADPPRHARRRWRRPKAPQLIPIAVGLLSPTSGSDLARRPLAVARWLTKSAASANPPVASEGDAGTLVLRLDAKKSDVRVRGRVRTPVPSVLRGFSAPVKLEMCPRVPRPSPLRARQRFGHVQQVGSGANVGARRRRSRDARSWATTTPKARRSWRPTRPAAAGSR